MKGIPAYSLLVKVARGVFQFGVDRKNLGIFSHLGSFTQQLVVGVLGHAGCWLTCPQRSPLKQLMDKIQVGQPVGIKVCNGQYGSYKLQINANDFIRVQDFVQQKRRLFVLEIGLGQIHFLVFLGLIMSYIHLLVETYHSREGTYHTTEWNSRIRTIIFPTTFGL